MELFEGVFSKASIYDTLFFNIKAVLEHPTLNDLRTNNPALCARWKYLSKSKYNQEITEIKPLPGLIKDIDDQIQVNQNNIYEEKAIFHPEFCRILVITYAKLSYEDGKLKRWFKKIANEDEYMVIATFMDVFDTMICF